MSALRLCALVLLLLLLPVRADEVRLLLLHTNDIHGHLEPVHGAVDSAGFVRLATLIRSLKATFPGQVVLLDGGDFAVGTPTSGLFKGLSTAECLRSVGYDAVALGNHEFDWGQEALQSLAQAVEAPVLCANLVEEASGAHPYQPWTVIERAGARLGVLGLVAPDTATRTPKAYTEGWRFLPAVPAAREAIASMPEVDVVIALTHIGVPDDIKLAAALPEISLIVGGHSHTALQELVVENGVPIVQSGCYCQFLGVLELLVDTDENSLEVLSYRLVPVDETLAPDPQVSAIVEGYASKVRPVLERVVGQAGADIVNKRDGESLDSPLGDLIADMLRAESGADFAFYNRGGVRGFLPAGPISVAQLHEMFPFDDNVVVLQATGRQIQDIVLEGTAAQPRLSPSGLTAVVAGDVATILTADGRPLDLEGKYTVATTNFLATGGDTMSSFPPLQVERVMPYTRDVVQSYIEKKGFLSPPPTGRVLKR